MFQIPGCWFGDLVGPRRVLTIIVSWWSIFTALSGLAWNTVSLMAIRFLFGVGEAGAFPIATRTPVSVDATFRTRLRAGDHARGVALGQAFTPPLVVALIAMGGWRTPFLAFGILGIAWAAIWYFYYRDTPDEHRSVNDAEVQLIHSDPARPGKGRRVPGARSSRTRPFGFSR